MSNEDEIIKKVADLAEKLALFVMEWLLMIAIPTMIAKGAWEILHGRDMWFACITIVFAAALIEPLKILRNR